MVQYSCRAQHASQAILDLFKLEAPNFKEVDLEIRFWAINYSNHPRKLYILKHSRDNSWKMHMYKYCTWDTKNISVLNNETLTESAQWKQKVG